MATKSIVPQLGNSKLSNVGLSQSSLSLSFFFFGPIISISTFKIKYKREKNNSSSSLLPNKLVQSPNRQCCAHCLGHSLSPLSILASPFLILVSLFTQPPCLDFLLPTELLIFVLPEESLQAASHAEARNSERICLRAFIISSYNFALTTFLTDLFFFFYIL